MDKVLALRESLKPLADAQGIKLSYLPIMIKVCVGQAGRRDAIKRKWVRDSARLPPHP
jgi:pyruvate/2-oxoglutarate dehydrogenase complex dihydrolipoamide acyltransferase (E2) component